MMTTTSPETTTQLFGLACPSIGLSAALTACGAYLEGAIGLFYSPATCLMGRWQDGQMQGSDGQSLNNLSQFFEAKVFNVNYELRWLKQPQNLGTAVILSETELTAFDSFSKDVSLSQPLIPHDQRYLLWGEGLNPKQDRSPQPNWSCLSAARIGRLDVPIANLQPNQRVQLLTREYFGELTDSRFDFGNVVVLEERLLGLAII
jgi:CRISPR-associated protein (TIGR03984 family)